MAETVFELETISNRETGTLVVKDFDTTYALAEKIIAEHPIVKIENDEVKKQFKATRATFNKIVKAIDRKRIDTLSEFGFEFEGQCNLIKHLFEEHQARMGEAIKEYEDSQKLVVAEGETAKPKVITATLKFYDEKIVKKLTDFAQKNGCELSIK